MNDEKDGKAYRRETLVLNYKLYYDKTIKVEEGSKAANRERVTVELRDGEKVSKSSKRPNSRLRQARRHWNC